MPKDESLIDALNDPIKALECLKEWADSGVYEFSYTDPYAEEKVELSFQTITNTINIIEAYKIAINRCIELCDRQGINSKQRIKSILMELIKEPQNEQKPAIK